MSHKILIYPDSRHRYLFRKTLEALNDQSDFDFQQLEETDYLQKITEAISVEYRDFEKELYEYKINKGYSKEDLLIIFTKGLLSDKKENKTRLYMSGKTIYENN